MRDLNYQLKLLCRRNRDGGYLSRSNRERILTLIANQLHEMGFHHMVARGNDHYGIGRRQYVSNESRALELDPKDLKRIGDAHVRLGVELQRAFGLRREEAIKFSPRVADRDDRICLRRAGRRVGKRERFRCERPHNASC